MSGKSLPEHVICGPRRLGDGRALSQQRLCLARQTTTATTADVMLVQHSIQKTGHENERPPTPRPQHTHAQPHMAHTAPVHKTRRKAVTAAEKGGRHTAETKKKVERRHTAGGTTHGAFENSFAACRLRSKFAWGKRGDEEKEACRHYSWNTHAPSTIGIHSYGRQEFHRSAVAIHNAHPRA